MRPRSLMAFVSFVIRISVGLLGAWLRSLRDGDGPSTIPIEVFPRTCGTNSVSAPNSPAVRNCSKIVAVAYRYQDPEPLNEASEDLCDLLEVSKESGNNRGRTSL